MTTQHTAQLGIHAICDELDQAGCQRHSRVEGGQSSKIGFLSKNGGQVHGCSAFEAIRDLADHNCLRQARGENPVEREYWIFVDIGVEPHVFYPVPAWWIANDIYEIHQKVT